MKKEKEFIQREEAEIVSDSNFRDYLGYDLKVENTVKPDLKQVKGEKGGYRVSIYSPEQPKEEKVVVLCASLEGVAKAVCAKAASMYGFYFYIIVESLVTDSNDLLVVDPGCSRRIVFSKSMNSADILKFL
ncbi:hypothetical protein PF672P1_00011 [Parabacteroides phage PF672P1]|nr:hypothetical protein PF672P1_00011 [Parabacteroides phage PF672P1]